MEISKEFSERVYQDGLLCLEDPLHPCRPMVDWQADNGFSPFQLPEPFTGAKSDLNLAFFGLNPSISQSSQIPKASSEWTLEKYDHYYRYRFEDAERTPSGKLVDRVTLWNNIEHFGNSYLSELIDGQFQIGKNATLLEAVRYKSTGGWLGHTGREKRKILEHQHSFSQSLLEDSGCKIIVPLGSLAIDQVNQLLKLPKPIPTKIGDAMGKTFIGETLHGSKIYVCPIKHMSYHARREMSAAVGR